MSQQTKVGETKNFQRLKKKTQIIGNKKHIEGGAKFTSHRGVHSNISFDRIMYIIHLPTCWKSVEEVEI